MDGNSELSNFELAGEASSDLPRNLLDLVLYHVK